MYKTNCRKIVNVVTPSMDGSWCRNCPILHQTPRNWFPVELYPWL